nr:homoserine O-succinyltransferase [Budvicia aquatica]
MTSTVISKIFQDQNFDGLIVTGAPLGLVEFDDVAYWRR